MLIQHSQRKQRSTPSQADACTSHVCAEKEKTTKQDSEGHKQGARNRENDQTKEPREMTREILCKARRFRLTRENLVLRLSPVIPFPKYGNFQALSCYLLAHLWRTSSCTSPVFILRILMPECHPSSCWILWCIESIINEPFRQQPRDRPQTTPKMPCHGI
jgi:hypothetical protein